MNIDSQTLADAEQFFRERIPLTRTMGIRVVSFDNRGLRVEAPVALNRNHLETAFGGSINAVATLAAYGLLWLALRDLDAHVVVAESSIRFLQPIRERIAAVCSPPTDTVLENFLQEVRTRGKARITLAVRVEENGTSAAEFQGTFVALRNVST